MLYKRYTPLHAAIIEAKLQAVEAEHQVTILFAVESGSQAWGFASGNSDYDVRFVYRHRPDWYLSVFPQRDVIEYPMQDELDLSGWDLRKALQLFAKSNPALLEWLKSPVTYQETTDFRATLLALEPEYVSLQKLYWHYLAMAKGNYRGYLKQETVRIKKYFYVLRPLLACRWLEKHRTAPPMEFDRLLARLPANATDLLQEIRVLLAAKRAGTELEEEPAIPVINSFIDNELARCAAVAPQLPHRRPDASRLDAVMQRYIAA